MAVRSSPPKGSASHNPKSKNGTGGLAAFIEASRERKVHRHCLVCDQPPHILNDLNTLLEQKAAGHIPYMTLPMVCGYFAKEHNYDVTWQALRNHITLCRGAKWAN